MTSFESLGLQESLITAVKKLGFENPMPIQQQIIPLLLQEECKDIIALAQTGTGKTAAFGLPIIQKTNTKSKKVEYLILSPTRELCLQIADDLKDYSVNTPNINIAAVFGGSSMDRQIQKIKQGAQIISATPGRLNDLINRRVIDLSNVKAVILDEADEMLHMGFKDDLEAILEQTPQERNTFLFSATMPKQLVSIANKYMNSPIEVTIGVRNSGAENVEHTAYFVHAKDRYLALKRIVDYHPNIYGIVFCRTRQETKDVADKLAQDGYNAEALHGDLSQSQREYVMGRFRTRHLRLLVATDVAARGIDVDDLTHIINYALPDELEIYTHRSGRTGRAGKKGASIVIAHLKEKQKLVQIEKQIQKKFTILPIPGGRDICEKQLFHLIDKVEKVEIDHKEVESFLPQIYNKLEWMDRNELIQRFVSVEFNRFLDYYKNIPDINSPADGKSFDKSRERRNSNYTRFFINLGKTDNLIPTQLIGMINDFTGNRNIDIGEIDIMKNFSFFEVDSEYQSEVLHGFTGKKLKKRTINIEIAERQKDQNKSNRKRDKKSSSEFRNEGRSSRKKESYYSGNNEKSEKKRSKKKHKKSKNR